MISHRLWVKDVPFVRFQNRFLNTKIFTWFKHICWFLIGPFFNSLAPKSSLWRQFHKIYLAKWHWHAFDSFVKAIVCHCCNTTLAVVYYTSHFYYTHLLHSIQFNTFHSKRKRMSAIQSTGSTNVSDFLTVRITLMISRSPEAIQRLSLDRRIANLFQQLPIIWTINPANQNTKLINHFYQHDPQHHQGRFHQNDVTKLPEWTRGRLIW